MAGIKRKSVVSDRSDGKVKSKKLEVEKKAAKQAGREPSRKRSKKVEVENRSDGSEESDTSEQENGFYGFSANKKSGRESSESNVTSDEEVEDSKSTTSKEKISKGSFKPIRDSGGDQRGSALANLNGT